MTKTIALAFTEFHFYFNFILNFIDLNMRINNARAHLVGSLVCRATGGTWSFDYTKKHSIEANIAGIETSVSCRVPEKELLIAFKIHSARRADIRDVVMLREDKNLERILEHLRSGRKEALRDQLNRIIEALKDPRLADSKRSFPSECRCYEAD